MKLAALAHISIERGVEYKIAPLASTLVTAPAELQGLPMVPAVIAGESEG